MCWRGGMSLHSEDNGGLPAPTRSRKYSGASIGKNGGFPGQTVECFGNYGIRLKKNVRPEAITQELARGAGRGRGVLEIESLAPNVEVRGRLELEWRGI